MFTRDPAHRQGRGEHGRSNLRPHHRVQEVIQSGVRMKPLMLLRRTCLALVLLFDFTSFCAISLPVADDEGESPF